MICIYSGYFCLSWASLEGFSGRIALNAGLAPLMKICDFEVWPFVDSRLIANVIGVIISSPTVDFLLT